MSKIYTNRQNAIRAARKVLGPEAKPGEQFTIDAVEGGLAWAPIAPAAPEAPAPVQAPEATSAYQAELGAPNRGEYRRTPEGEPTVGDLVRPGMLVRTSYGTEGLVRSVSGPNALLIPPDQGLETFSIDYGTPNGTKLGTLNELVAVGGRILKLFAANADEVFFEEAPAVSAPVPDVVPALEPVGGLLAELEAQQAEGEAVAAATSGAPDCPSKRDSLARIAAEFFEVSDLATDMRHGLPVSLKPCPIRTLREALTAAYEAGHAAKGRARQARAAKAPGASREPRGPGRPREGSKLVQIVALLTRPEGATTREILDATGWPAVSVPQQAKAGGLDLRKQKLPGQRSRYFGTPIAAATAETYSPAEGTR